MEKFLFLQEYICSEHEKKLSSLHKKLAWIHVFNQEHLHDSLIPQIETQNVAWLLI